MARGKVVPVEKVWLSTSELMAYLGMSRRSVDRLRNGGLIHCYAPFEKRTYYYLKEEVDTKIRKGKVRT